MATSQYNNPQDSYDVQGNFNKNQQLTDTERLNKLEKEVSCLRTDFDRMKYEQAIAEAAIGRAIIRGSASLSGCLISPHRQNNNQDRNNLMLENCPMDSSNIPKSQKSQCAPGKTYSANEIAKKLKKNEKEDCGYFTLG